MAALIQGEATNEETAEDEDAGNKTLNGAFKMETEELAAGVPEKTKERRRRTSRFVELTFLLICFV